MGLWPRGQGLWLVSGGIVIWAAFLGEAQDKEMDKDKLKDKLKDRRKDKRKDKRKDTLQDLRSGREI